MTWWWWGAVPAACRAQGARLAGAASVLVLERENRLGGILNQCVHDGFGLVRYREALTGPEYAQRAREEEARSAGADLMTGAMVTGLTRDRTLTAVTRRGLLTCQAGAVVLATGCRERTRGPSPSRHPAGGGVYGGDSPESYEHQESSGGPAGGGPGLRGHRSHHGPADDPGGAKVLCVAEQRPAPGGLARNVRQCLTTLASRCFSGAR